MSLKGRKWFGYIFTSILILVIGILILIIKPDIFIGTALYIMCGLVGVYLIFAASNIIKSFITSAWFQEKLSGK
ncbi:hypothetical protein LCGC14_0503010 [marine sediment metagenome]|uniref:Uncharacterized protein n=1 Tax=marine sediment metagenome TaxID=412755 RepID=A0A0F9VC33_9ZZZZ